MTIYSILKNSTSGVTEAKNREVSTKPGLVKLKDGRELETDSEDAQNVSGAPNSGMNDTEPASSIDLNPDKPGEPEEMEGSRESPGLDPAPLPGSIAYREHRKWIEKAIQLPNNPYSQASIERRLSKGSVNSGEESISSARTTGDLYLIQPANPTASVTSCGIIEERDKGLMKLDCGPHSIDNKYKRDYYINEDGAVIMTSENAVLNSNYIQCIATNKTMSVSQNGKTRTEREISELKEQREQNLRDFNKTREDDIKKGGEYNRKFRRQTLRGGENIQGVYHGINGGEMVRNGERNSDMSETNSETVEESEDETSEFPTINVSDGIRRFQEEIKKREQENKKWSRWKRERSKPILYRTGSAEEGSKPILYRSGSMDSLLDTDHTDYSQGPKLPPKSFYKSQDDLTPPLPPKMKHVSKRTVEKRVSYAPNEVTVLGPKGPQITESRGPQEAEARGQRGPREVREEDNLSKSGGGPTSFNLKCENKSRQIRPSSHLPPVEPPGSGPAPCIPDEDYLDAPDDSLEAPILPSVQDLRSMFQAKPSSQQRMKPQVKKVEKVPAMLKIPTPQSSTKFHQVHSLTARSVSREFREGLKAGQPRPTDSIVKLPDNNRYVHNNNNNNNNNNSVTKSSSAVVLQSVEVSSSSNSSKYTRSENYRNLSPEYSGIPALPLTIPYRRGDHDTGYTSDDSLNHSPDNRRSPSREKRSSVKNKGRSSPHSRGPVAGAKRPSGARQAGVMQASGAWQASEGGQQPTRKEWTVWT